MATFEVLIVAEQMSSAITVSTACLRVEQMSRNITTAAIPFTRKDDAYEIYIPMGDGISPATGAHFLDWG